MPQGPRQLRDGVPHTQVEEEEVRFADLFTDAASADVTGDCTPPMDVLEVTGAVEVRMDLPGIRASDLRVVFTHGTLVVAGRKLPAACPHREAAFHLAERSFGRFVRAVRVTGAVDAGHASATLTQGELRVRLPRIAERRGGAIHIPLEPS